ncbi:hypothetical protein [Caulobacter sp. Root655]|uniref:hypothetical protein n=1 Tax=Caulobacter sp. Root655 TaxID=1736578 RepID=UPI000AAF1A39|nr:hypothetical protein [Caulobacter sp. Root655]
MLRTALVFLAVLGLAVSSAQATVVRGTVIRAEGRTNASCRMVGLKLDSGSILYFRLPSTSDGDSMLSVALTALASRLPVEVQYNPAIPASCGGSEPNIEIIAILGA